ncbi:MAG: diphosphate--fructose-6-phosphate 1-phosphotransferase [Verrucomicrobiota bacterium]
MTEISNLQKARAAYEPKLPQVFAKHNLAVKIVKGGKTESVADQAEIKAMFPNTYGLPVLGMAKGTKKVKAPALKVGVVLSGGQAPGGHNVIAGLFDGLKTLNAGSVLYGFLGGPKGLVENKYKVLDHATIDAYRNTGGFDIIGSGRDKLDKPEQFDKVAANCKELGIKAVVVIGGDDSNTNACLLAEYFLQHKTGIQVIGCPKTIDGDLKNEQIETSFGFDTATKVYSELIGNIQRDALSAKKYWHFIKLMGRSASHIALECALQTHPNVTLISEEIAAQRQSLKQITTYIAGIIRDRGNAKQNFGVVLIPEGLVEFVPEIKQLIHELNDIIGKHKDEFEGMTLDGRVRLVQGHLLEESLLAFNALPSVIQMQLLKERDSHGNVQVSLIETEKLLIELVAKQLAKWKEDGTYTGKFAALNHFFGYEGRCAAPSNFDADYGYSLGYTSSLLIADGQSGYMAVVSQVSKPASEWTAGGIPLTMMMNMERRHNKHVPVIRKALVELNGKPFQVLLGHREVWAVNSEYIFPGPIQYFGPSEVCDQPTVTLKQERA